MKRAAAQSPRSHEEQIRALEAEISRLRQEVERLGAYRELAYRDDLTGLRNRRYFVERLGQELARAARTRTPCSVLFLDLDDFKRINDELGHPTGDLVLRTLGRLLLHNQRTMDVACRVGGDELAVILPNTSAEGAEHVRRRLEELARAELGEGRLLPELDVTLSFGAATFPDHGETIDGLLLAADRRMYAHKRGRRPSASGAVGRAA